jgi:coenzyme Q-binding protein COQ10
MPQFSTTRRVRHAASDMFDLVADVERYPEFVPLCESLKVLRRAASGEGVEIVTARMTVAYKLLRETFTSRVTLDRPRLAIAVEYLDGPFSHLDNRWTFRTLGERECEVVFSIIYEFRSRTLGFVMGSVFDAAFRRFAQAFERRADEVYGRPAAAQSG